VVHPGTRYGLGDRVEAIGMADLLRELVGMGHGSP
jgi:hypothetical protein